MIAEDLLPRANRFCEDGWAVVKSICGAKKWRRRTRKLEEGNEFADHAKIYNAEHGKYSSAPIEVIDASVPPAPVTLHPERSPSPAAHCQSIPDAKANFSFPNRVAAPKKMDCAKARRAKAIFVAHCSK